MLRTIRATFGRISVVALKALFPAVARRALERILLRFRRRRAARRRRRLARLRWSRPGAVWAMDFASLRGRRTPDFLLIRDLASKCTLHARRLLGRGAPVAARLATLFCAHGAPLVLKSDNGSHFVNAEVEAVLRSFEVTHLRSPVRRPAYNGSIEASVAPIRSLAFDCARRAQRDLPIDPDLDLAAHILDQRTDSRRAHAPTRAQRWDSRTPPDDGVRKHFTATRARHRQRLLVERGLAEHGNLTHAARASIERAATRDALLECQLLSFNRP